MVRPPVLRAVGLVLVVCWLVLPLAGCAGTGTGPSGTARSGMVVFPAADRQPAPALRADLLDGGGSYDLAGQAGTVVVVNFWAQWCGPCVAEADDLEQTYQATRASGVTFLGINTRDERDKARSFLVGRTTYPNVFDPAGRLASGFAVPPNAIPATIIVDRAGRIAALARTAVLRSDLEPVVLDLAAEASHG